MVFTGRFSKTVLASTLLLVCLPTIGGSAWRLSQHRRTRSPRDDRLTSARSTSARRRSTARGNEESEPQRSTARCDRNRGAAGAQASRHSSWRDHALAGRAARRRRAPVAVVSREREDRAQPPPERRRRNHGGGVVDAARGLRLVEQEQKRGWRRMEHRGDPFVGGFKTSEGDLMQPVASDRPPKS